MTDPVIGPSVITLSFATLQSEAKRLTPMFVTEHGTLIIAGRSEWTPVRFAPGLTGLICERVDRGGIPPATAGNDPEHVNPPEA